MHEARTTDIPFAAFAVCRVLNSGHATILSYEIPSPILVDKRLAAYLPRPRSYPLGLEMIAETNCTLDAGDAIILVSDGVSQAGLGHTYRMGWGMSLASGFVNGCLMDGIDLEQVPERILGRVKDLSGATYGDDTTCLLLLCREARVLNILTGPPSNEAKDAEVVRRFMEMKGSKAVCGSTTTEICARLLKTPAVIKGSTSDDYLKPPSYEIEGIDLATEGAITLNQVYNIMDEKADKLEAHSPVWTSTAFFTDRTRSTSLWARLRTRPIGPSPSNRWACCRGMPSSCSSRRSSRKWASSSTSNTFDTGITGIAYVYNFRERLYNRTVAPFPMAQVMIIDDDVVMCEMLSSMVLRTGHDASSAHTLKEGMGEISSKNYDIVFLDIRMPDGSGLDVLPRIRERPSPRRSSS